ncbi:hypothetical protein [Thiothrix winogradskyi]|uniref:Permuted papain-like amidase YaeF/Yiix C92 family enzyme n=1 Tax=Thiothrix winogradskyi TaxID=96472 RepID=A0ABY3T0E5_9GAMM|nr:hypothetical protein [Thiothrix winogradskyi]UJS25282.1 hypothetical protein L2Y54_04375 [Thiothrix winogradskyi]
MSRLTVQYEDVRNKMKPGDIIAFSGKGNISDIIKWATRSSVSHVAVILHSQVLINGEPERDYINEVIESTSLNGFSGVIRSRLSDRLRKYEGEVWWLPLRDAVREKMDLGLFCRFLLDQEGKEYDMPQAVKSSLDALDMLRLAGSVTYNIEDFAKFFCSELAAAGLEASGAIRSVNSSEVTPVDLCMFSIYQNNYYQIKGDEKDIKGYNSLSPEGWGE